MSFLLIQHILKPTQIKEIQSWSNYKNKKKKIRFRKRNKRRERKNRKKAFEYKEKEELKRQRINTTDPDSGYYHRDHKEEGFMYLDHRTVDGKNNIIIDCHITPGNIHDSGPYIDRLDQIEKTFGLIPGKVALDSGYYSLDILKQLDKKYIFSNRI